jgi:predicted ATP-binding protein involved in virulence
MRIESLYLKNFRNVEEQTFRLNPHFTVFIGINGRGKSTWLHALRIACGTFLLAVPDAKKRHIVPDEVRRQSHGSFMTDAKPVVIEARGTFVGLPEPVIWRRRVLEGVSGTTSSQEDVGIVRNMGKQKYEAMKSGSDDLDLPVIAFFGTSRVHGAGRNRSTRIGRQIFKEGYHSWYEMRSSIFGYESWLASYPILVKEGKEYPETEVAFWEAVKTANPYIKQISFEHGELWLKVEMDDYTSEYLPIRLHSDGIISFTEMAAELAYRCIVLNGNKRDRAVKDTTGVTLIDELDLHLHPNWQRHVVSDLKCAFPNVQFIATTHSPFIVQSLAADELINLDQSVETAPGELSIDQVATLFMGVKSEFSESNEALEKKSTDILEKIKGNEPVDEDIRDIGNPAVRAFLELAKMANGK